MYDCVHVSFSPLRGLQLNILFISHFDIFLKNCLLMSFFWVLLDYFSRL